MKISLDRPSRWLAALLCSLSVSAFAIDPVSVSASSDDGNVPVNTIDNNLNTRWSADGDGQWIEYDLGASYTVETLEIAFYKGGDRLSSFDVETSTNGRDWITVFSGQQSLRTSEPQTVNVTDTHAQFLRIVGYGNTVNSWNSLTEVNVSVLEFPGGGGGGNEGGEIMASSSSDDGNVASHVLDADLSTRWSASGTGEWLQLDLVRVQQVGSVNIAFHKGNERAAFFEIETSIDGNTWVNVLTGASSSATTAGFEAFSVLDGHARFVRFVGYGNSDSSWNSITEISVSSEGGGDSNGGGGGGECEPEPASGDVVVACLERGIGGRFSEADVNPSNNPDQNFDLRQWKITYPDASEEFPPQVVNNEFYTGSDGAMVFECLNTGGSTTNSSYSRSELREMLNKDAGTTNLGNNWVISTASSSDKASAGAVDGNMKATVVVDHVSRTSDDGDEWRLGRVIVGQIHASDDEPLKLYYRKLPGHTKGWVYMAYEDSDTEVFVPLFGESGTDKYGLTSTIEPIEMGIELGEKWGYEIDVKGREMVVTVTKSDGTWVSQSITWADEYNDDWFYFKAGAYNQNNGGQTGDYAQVSFYNLVVTHGNN